MTLKRECSLKRYWYCNLKLHKIRLENIRSYITEEVVFPDGKVLLWGNIGSGKSSILYAIDFVLFGLQRSELAGASLLRNGCEEGSVELWFSLDDKEYVLKRVLKRTKTGVVQDAGYIVRDGLKQDKTALELKQIVLELLHYPKDLITKNKTLIYRYTVYTPQEEMKTILLGPKEERLDTLRKVFGVDKYKRIKENSKTVISELKDRKKIYEGAISDLQEKVVEKEKREDEKKIFEQKIQSFSLQFELVQKQLAEKKEQFGLLELKREELHKVKNELSLALLEERTKQEELERNSLKEKENKEEIILLEKEELIVPQGVKEKMLSLESATFIKEQELRIVLNSIPELKRKKEEHDKITQREKLLEEEIGILEKEELIILENLKEKISLLDTKLLDQEKELRTVLNTYQELKTKKEHGLHIKMKIESLNTCPTCFQVVSTEYKQKIVDGSIQEAQQFSQAMEEAQLKQIALEKDIQYSRAELELFKKKESESALIRFKLQNLQQKKNERELLLQQKKALQILPQEQETLEQKQITLEKEIQSFRKELEVLRRQESESALIQLKLETLQRRKIELGICSQRNIELRTSLDVLLVHVEQLAKKQESLASFDVLYAPLKIELEQVEAKIQELSLEKMHVEISLGHTLSLLQSLDQEIEKKTQLRDKKERLNSIQFWLTESFIPLMDTMEKNVLFKVHEEFNTVFEKWFSTLIDNQNLVMSLDEEYTPKILQNGYDIEYEFLSGGEKTAGALAYRLALNQVINKLNVGIKTQDLLILDEPTDGFSSEQLDRLKILMDEIQIPQIILVSHEAQIECFADHIIRFEKRDHVTKVIS